MLLLCCCVAQFNLIGLGGRYALEYPPTTDLGECARGQWTTHRFTIVNSGQVSASLNFAVDASGWGGGSTSTTSLAQTDAILMSYPPPPPVTGSAAPSTALVLSSNTNSAAAGSGHQHLTAPSCSLVPINGRPRTSERAVGTGVSAFGVSFASPTAASAAGAQEFRTLDSNLLVVRVVPHTKTLAAGARAVICMQVFVPPRAQRTNFAFTLNMKVWLFPFSHRSGFLTYQWIAALRTSVV